LIHVINRDSAKRKETTAATAKHQGDHSFYYDPVHKAAVARMQHSLTARSEWPTYLLAVTIYGGWFGILTALRYGTLSLWSATPILILLLVWYMSLQHELLHGHPTRFPLFNKLLGIAPLAIWYPYTLYRDTHLAHHRDVHLTVPGVDPESNYVSQTAWQSMGRLSRGVWHVRKTFLGRLLVAPPMAIASLVVHTLGEWKNGRLHYLTMWLTHIALVAGMLAFIGRYSHLPAWHYVFLMSWPALAIAMVRSFYEHRAAPEGESRVTINDAGWMMRLLYLNNNYHLVHHALPRVAWYQLPAAYRLRRTQYRQQAGSFWVPGGYGALLRRYAFRQTDAPVHPESR